MVTVYLQVTVTVLYDSVIQSARLSVSPGVRAEAASSTTYTTVVPSLVLISIEADGAYLLIVVVVASAGIRVGPWSPCPDRHLDSGPGPGRESELKTACGSLSPSSFQPPGQAWRRCLA